MAARITKRIEHFFIHGGAAMKQSVTEPRAHEAHGALSLRTLNRVLAGAVVVCLAGMLAGTWLTITGLPPVPERVESEDGILLFTDGDITAGKEVFLKYNLMSYGSLLGNGAYYGPDYTAEYLHLISEGLPAQREEAIDRLRHTQPVSGVLSVPSWWAETHERARAYYERFYVTGNARAGVGPRTIPTAEEAHRFADFVAWTGWISVAQRPGSEGSYANNWPYVPVLGNTPTPGNLFWSAMTIAIVLLLAAGVVVVYEYVSVEAIPDLPAILPPGRQKIFSAQKAVVPLFAVAALLFLIQTVAGGYLANAFASREDFYGLFEKLGLQRAVIAPFSALRAVHVDLGVIWVVGLWMASALFIAPFLGGAERPWLRRGTRALTAVILVSVIGSLIGIYLATRNLIGQNWFWLGSEGMEYVDMGRVWKIGIAAAFALWIALMLGWYLKIMKQPSGHLQRVLVGIGIGISAAFLPSLFFLPESNFVLADFWRWWTVHLWVEGIFAFFQVAVLATLFWSLKLVDREMVTKSVYLEGILVVLAGSFSIGHHYWWVGEPSFWISIGSIFSTLEIVPLFLLLFHALGAYRKIQEPASNPHRLALLFLIASAVWQFIGSGVLGLILNLPIINYYEHGTYLTVAHAHGSFLGGFGFLSIGLMLYALRFSTTESAWPARSFRWSFYLLNAGLALMLFISVTPVGLIQVFAAFSKTFHASRELAFYEQPAVQLLMKARMPGDTLIIVGAALLALPIIKLAWQNRKVGAGV